MGQFRGGEPLVGEITGLRTFRVDQTGALLPLYCEQPWRDGPNTALCTPPTGHHHRAAHAVPADECECGFYAYGSVAAARQNRNMRHVQAVVSCWGGVVAGTQGIRAEHARIDAVWLSPHAPDWLRRRVAARYSSARLYADRAAMLAEHPLTVLPCYRPPQRLRRLAVALLVAVVTAALALGALPIETLRGSPALWTSWVVVTAGVGALTAWLLLGTRGAGHWTAAFVVAGALGWMLAPLFGLPGWLLRLPLLRAVVVAVGGYLFALRPRHFPLVDFERPRIVAGLNP